MKDMMSKDGTHEGFLYVLSRAAVKSNEDLIARLLEGQGNEQEVLDKIDQLVRAGWENANTLEEAYSNLTQATDLIKRLMEARQAMASIAAGGDGTLSRRGRSLVKSGSSCIDGVVFR